MIVFRHADPRYPFLWEDASQPPGRWHGPGEGPAHYFADTPTGAWAEFVRHEEIKDPQDLAGVRRALWAIELDALPRGRPNLPLKTLQGGPETYPRCQREARRLRKGGATGFHAPSAAVLPAGARGWVVDGGLREAVAREGVVFVLFGPQPTLHGWRAAEAGAPPGEVLRRVRHFTERI